MLGVNDAIRPVLSQNKVYMVTLYEEIFQVDLQTAEYVNTVKKFAIWAIMSKNWLLEIKFWEEGAN